MKWNVLHSYRGHSEASHQSWVSLLPLGMQGSGLGFWFRVLRVGHAVCEIGIRQKESEKIGG